LYHRIYQIKFTLITLKDAFDEVDYTQLQEDMRTGKKLFVKLDFVKFSFFMFIKMNNIKYT